MTETERERQLLQRVLAEGHRSTRDRTPPFELLWSRAAAGMRPPRRAHRSRRVLATAAVVLVLAATIAWWIADRQRHGELERAMAVAATAGEWRPPLDFLLATPGQEWLDATPRWTLDPALEPSLAPDLIAPETHRR